MSPSSAAAKLRVAVLAPIAWRVPPRHYGPWEQFASLLTEGLVDRGVDVTLFATGDSITAARLRRSSPTGYAEDPTVDAEGVRSACTSPTVFERAAEFDVIHNSFDFLPLTYSRLVDTPVVTTIHGFSSPRIVPVFEQVQRRGATTSRSATPTGTPTLDYAATIHHGIDMRAFDLQRRRRAATCCSSAGSIPTRARPRRSTSPHAPASR